ncbi:hypothetical protein SOASR030_19760 [Leminorella grimontii]|uniref:Uncharacterized protein n=1 Tax=Leminorella grimontii TaxID=82981 RepID=A0AAV5N407_9GAMM|nr:hypothetical protein SOASR030_19760 [Leminorella grimontii]
MAIEEMTLRVTGLSEEAYADAEAARPVMLIHNPTAIALGNFISVYPYVHFSYLINVIAYDVN